MEEDTQSRTVRDASKWKLNPSLFQKICKYRGTPEMDIFSSLTSIILKEDSVRPSNTNSSNTKMADTVLVPSVSVQMSIKNPLLLSSISNLLIGPNKKNNQLIEKQNLQLLAWTVSGKHYLQKDYQKSLPSLVEMPEDHG